MPENTPMKMQWINIDGRSTPIVLPQIWDHEKQDWIVTGTENPLPTQVTGSIVEKQVEVLSVSKNLNDIVHLGKNATRGSAYSAKPVDVSNYINKMIVIHNKGNVAIILDQLRYYLEGDIDENSLVMSQNISTQWIEAGGVEIIDKELVEALSVALPFMNIRIGQINSLFDVYFLGVK